MKTVVFLCAISMASASSMSEAQTPKNAGGEFPGLPGAVHFGATLEATRAAVAASCPKIEVREIKPPFLDIIKDKQMQIDCEGLVFLGKARHVEFVIGDDRLGMIWLMAQPDEESAIVALMTKTFGPPQRPNPNYWLFPNHNAAYRRDKSEILYYADERGRDVAEDLAPAK
jgi:hypothetical protein